MLAPVDEDEEAEEDERPPVLKPPSPRVHLREVCQVVTAAEAAYTLVPGEEVGEEEEDLRLLRQRSRLP